MRLPRKTIKKGWLPTMLQLSKGYNKKSTLSTALISEKQQEFIWWNFLIMAEKAADISGILSISWTIVPSDSHIWMFKSSISLTKILSSKSDKQIDLRHNQVHITEKQLWQVTRDMKGPFLVSRSYFWPSSSQIPQEHTIIYKAKSTKISPAHFL